MLGPRQDGEYTDRKLDCESEIEPLFQVLLHLAEDAGWSAQECYQAIINLCVCHATGDLQDDAVQEVIDLRRSAAPA